MTWQKLIVAEGKAIADADGSVTIDMPRSNRIGEIAFTLRGTGGSGTPAAEALITKIELIGNGNSSIVACNNSQIRDITQMRMNGMRSEVVNATSAATRVTTNVFMGRFKHDPVCILPSYLFSTLQLKLTFGTLIATTAFATGTVVLDVFVDEFVKDGSEPADSQCIIQKYTEVEAFTAATSGDRQVKLQRGHSIAAIYVAAAGTDGTSISKFKVSLNNGAVTPLAETWLKSQNDDVLEYGLASGTKIANATMVDFDNPATEQIFGEVINTDVNSGVLEADLILSQGAAVACSVVQITYVSVASL